mgnify:FL=1
MIEFNATFLVAMLSFVVFIMIMNAIFYRPILNIMRKRDEYINSNYDEAKKLSEQAEKLDIKKAETIQQTQNECRTEIKNVVENAQGLASKNVQDARTEVKNEIQLKKDSLVRESEALEGVLKSGVVTDLASSITSKFMSKDLAVNK